MFLALVLAAALTPAVSPSPVCGDVDSISFEDAFQYELRDVAALRLIAALAQIPPARQAAFFAAGGAAHDVPACLSPGATHAAARALTLIANLWGPDVVGDDSTFAAFSRRVAAAFAAVTPPAPFARLLSQSAADKPACATPDQTPATIAIVNPRYTAGAIAARASGSVEASILLDENGLVRTAHITARLSATRRRPSS